MRRPAITLVAWLVALGAGGAAGAGAGTDVVRSTTQVAFDRAVLFVPCGERDGEPVDLRGTAIAKTTAIVKAGEVVRISIDFDFDEVIGTGRTTGGRYLLRGGAVVWGTKVDRVSWSFGSESPPGMKQGYQFGLEGTGGADRTSYDWSAGARLDLYEVTDIVIGGLRSVDC